MLNGWPVVRNNLSIIKPSHWFSPYKSLTSTLDLGLVLCNLPTKLFALYHQMTIRTGIALPFDTTQRKLKAWKKCLFPLQSYSWPENQSEGRNGYFCACNTAWGPSVLFYNWTFWRWQLSIPPDRRSHMKSSRQLRKDEIDGQVTCLLACKNFPNV